jgi:hypothetical protein
MTQDEMNFVLHAPPKFRPVRVSRADIRLGTIEQIRDVVGEDLYDRFIEGKWWDFRGNLR